MDVKVTDTHTTEASATLTHAQLLDVLGLAVKVSAGIPGDNPGATTTVVFGDENEAGEFDTTVTVVVDHNYVPPAAPNAASGADASGASLKSDPNIAAPSASASPVAPSAPVLMIPGGAPATSTS